MITICMLCDSLISSSGTDTKISHGLCKRCLQAYIDAMAGKTVEVRFENPENPNDFVVMDLEMVDFYMVEFQRGLNRSKKVVVGY